MKINESPLDRLIRLILGIVIFLVGFLGFRNCNNTLAIILEIVGILLFITGLTGYCLLYSVFGIKTKKEIPETKEPTPPTP